AEFRRAREVRDKLNELLAAEGAAVVLEPDSGRRNHYGVIMLGSGGSRDPAEERALPQVIVAAEHWNRVARLLRAGQPVQLSVDVRATFHDQDLQGHDIVAEIPGSDPVIGEQLVMLGAHFDSWHPGTGATDNAVGSAVVMEAARLLKSLPRPPRRTIRIALWTGEEQGLLGSRAYVKQHFADPETMELLPEHGRLSGYFNLDNGGGRIRGIYLQGNEGCLPVFEAWLAPFADLEASTLTLRDTGGTDHLGFDAVGLPGFQFIQDPLDYGTRTHHTNMDLYERVIPDDAAQAAVIMAAFAWQAAMRDELLPREPLPEARKRPDDD
ncbi:MAG TPA: M20/M25/M40 family metallo-hydrolase, partial [Planctomycetota bacterium]|nr:M20/M25/M40 family metallo-hydrolase [Planctomycetota bacterium]